MLNLLGKILLTIGKGFLKMWQDSHSTPYLRVFQQTQENDLEFERLQEEQRRMFDEIAWRNAYEYDPHDKSDARNSFFYPHDPYDSHNSF